MAPAIFDRGVRFAELSATVAITSVHLDPCDIGKFHGDLSYEGGRLINYGYNFLEIVIFLLLLNYNQSTIVIILINYLILKI